MSTNPSAPAKLLIYTIKDKLTGKVMTHMRAKSKQTAFNAAADQLLTIELTDQETLLSLQAGDVLNVDGSSESQQRLPIDPPPPAPPASDGQVNPDPILVMTTALMVRGFTLLNETVVRNWTDEEREECEVYMEALNAGEAADVPNFLQIYDGHR